MPELTGIDLATKIKARDPLVPILLTTGHPDLVDAEITGLVDAVLPKPFATASLARAIHRLITRRPTVAEPPTG
jgi:FixJ family two-component response regulator